MDFDNIDCLLLVKTLNIKYEKKKSHYFFLKILGILFFIWFSGFIIFIIDALTFSPVPPLTDGIVVLAGGVGRINIGIKFLKENCSQYLLISGVGATTTLQDLKKTVSNFTAISCQDHILLGHNATSTMGNAIETAAWVHNYQLQSLTVITSNYHMRRAILELSNLLNNVPLYPYSIKTIRKKNFLKPSSIRLLFIEYNKLIMAYTGLIHTMKPKQDLIDIKH